MTTEEEREEVTLSQILRRLSKTISLRLEEERMQKLGAETGRWSSEEPNEAAMPSSETGADVEQIRKEWRENWTNCQRLLWMSEATGKFLDEAEQYLPAMTLEVDEEHGAVTLMGDTARNTYTKWLPGHGADMGIIFYEDDNTLAGIRMPLANLRLVVRHEGPLKINDGFRKGEAMNEKLKTTEETTEPTYRVVAPTYGGDAMLGREYRGWVKFDGERWKAAIDRKDGKNSPWAPYTSMFFTSRDAAVAWVNEYLDKKEWAPGEDELVK